MSTFSNDQQSKTECSRETGLERHLVLMEHADDASQAKDMLTAALASVLRYFAGFDRRVVRRLFQLDFQILLLGKNAPNKCCEESKVVARL